MLGPGWYRYSAVADNLTLNADTGDIMSMEGGVDPYQILALNAYQRGSTTLDMEAFRLYRKLGGAPAGGTTLTAYEYMTDGPAATVTVRSLPTTDVGASPEWEYHLGFNNLQEINILPIPELWIPCKIGDDFALGNLSGVAHTGFGFTVVWAEYHG